MLKIISWNIARRDEAWRCLTDTDADFALLQEAAAPPTDIAHRFDVDSAPWMTAGAAVCRLWRTAVVRLSSSADVQWFVAKPVGDAMPGELAVSRAGTLAAALIIPSTGDPFVAISWYAAWERPHAITGSRWIYADASVHRLISDISVFIGKQVGHRILVAGDLNILHGYGENGNGYWAARYATVFSRMAALGFDFVGPQAPAGQQAHPWPPELPRDSKNVPTFYTSQQTPAKAQRQLDFVFASRNLARHVHVTALNDPEQWGASDHCRVSIQVQT